MGRKVDTPRVLDDHNTFTDGTKAKQNMFIQRHTGKEVIVLAAVTHAFTSSTRQHDKVHESAPGHNSVDTPEYPPAVHQHALRITIVGSSGNSITGGAKVNRPVEECHENHATNKVAECDRQEAPDEQPCPPCEVLNTGDWTGSSDNRWHPLQEQPHRNEEHIGDAVFETRCHEDGNRQHRRHYLANRVGSSRRHPHAETD